MILRRSRFVHQIALSADRFLLIHAVSHLQLPIDREANIIVDFFAEPKAFPGDCEKLTVLVPYSLDIIGNAVRGLIERGILTEKTPGEEMDELAQTLGSTHGRDPAALLEKFRRERKEGGASYWSARSSTGVSDFSGGGHLKNAITVLLFGDCDLQMESDFLRQEALRRGIDLKVSATFPDDIRFASDHKHDAILIGALRSRHFIVGPKAENEKAHKGYVTEAKSLIEALRTHSTAPILIDNLPEPTVQPLGMAERGALGHRARFRLANIALSELAENFKDVYVTDIAAAIAAAGAERLLDDGQVGYTHFGSPGWMLQRPESEKRSVHGIFPDTAPLAALVDGNPYLREVALSKTHIDALMTVLGIERKKCVILDLDGTLWPGVLAETGSPFAWAPEISGVFSYIGLFIGLHEALLALKDRGIVLACVSKNDEATVRALWKYPANYPHKRLLTPDDFVSLRINWNDKVDNIRSIADELGFALESFLFIDDHPIERDRVRQRLPEVDVWGEDPFTLRRKLLTDPRLQLPSVTSEAGSRTGLVKSQLERKHFKAAVPDEATYLQSLNIDCIIEEVADDAPLPRIEELFLRTTQFNATGRKFSLSELSTLRQKPDAAIFVMHVKDRFGDHGLVGAAVIERGEILGLAVSCRVLGLGVEHRLVKHIMQNLPKPLSGIIIETDRNAPVRHIYRDNSFTETAPGKWSYASS